MASFLWIIFFLLLSGVSATSHNPTTFSASALSGIASQICQVCARKVAPAMLSEALTDSHQHESLLAYANPQQQDNQSVLPTDQLGDHNLLLTLMFCAFHDFQSDTAAMNDSLHATMKARDNKIRELTKLVHSCRKAAAQPESPIVRYETWLQTMTREVMSTLRVMATEAIAVLRFLSDGIIELAQGTALLIFVVVLVYCFMCLRANRVPFEGLGAIMPWRFR